MARYSPELLTALRYRYEQTDQPMNALAAEFEIGVTTLQTLARKNGWTPRSQRLRHCPPAMLLPEVVETLVANPPEQEEQTPTPALPLSGGGSEIAVALGAAVSPPISPVPGAPALSKAERLEALVEKEIAAEEATRAVLGIRPRSRNEAERCARTISKLTQALQTLQKLRGGDRTATREHDESPPDMDALREELARRLNGLIESQIGRDRMNLNDQLSSLSDDEVREIIAVGRERGMQALLQPPADEATEPD